jgi:uncharacterized small protein (DUF1192 family)
MKSAYEQFPLPDPVREIMETSLKHYEAARIAEHITMLHKEINRLNDELDNQKVVMDILIQTIRENRS